MRLRAHLNVAGELALISPATFGAVGHCGVDFGPFSAAAGALELPETWQIPGRKRATFRGPISASFLPARRHAAEASDLPDTTADEPFWEPPHVTPRDGRNFSLPAITAGAPQVARPQSLSWGGRPAGVVGW